MPCSGTGRSDAGHGLDAYGLKEFKERVGDSLRCEQCDAQDLLSAGGRQLLQSDPGKEYRTHHTNSYVSALVALKADPGEEYGQGDKMYAAFDVGTPH